MAARIAKADVQPPDRARIEARYAEEGLSPYSWGNGPGDRYDWHTHGYTKILYCVSGSIVFHTREGDCDPTAGPDLRYAPAAGETRRGRSRRRVLFEGPLTPPGQDTSPRPPRRVRGPLDVTAMSAM